MKTTFWLLPALLAMLVGSGIAGQQFPVQEVADGDGVVQTINICDSDGALDVTAATSTGTIAGAFAVEVYNLAASTNTLNCGLDVSVSSASTSAWYGREVLAGLGVVWQYRQGTGSVGGTKLQKVYCMTQNATGCTRATITQFK